ncbi:MAG: hypothetical protein DK841_02415 [Candidatus Melainabacteria bacterium]|nr:MAG: hypothetical protein DK841_02415 [Candidatus Melainabacteria bacterium]
MLAQTVRNNLKSIDKLNMRSKTTKFSDLFSTAPTVAMTKSEIRQVLMSDGLKEVAKDDELFDEISLPEEELESEGISSNIEDIENDCDFDIVEEPDIDDSEVAEYIVENPKEVVVQFPIISDIKLDEHLPFFRSISAKLAAL